MCAMDARAAGAVHGRVRECQAPEAPVGDWQYLRLGHVDQVGQEH